MCNFPAQLLLPLEYPRVYPLPAGMDKPGPVALSCSPSLSPGRWGVYLGQVGPGLGPMCWPPQPLLKILPVSGGMGTWLFPLLPLPSPGSGGKWRGGKGDLCFFGPATGGTGEGRHPFFGLGVGKITTGGWGPSPPLYPATGQFPPPPEKMKGKGPHMGPFWPFWNWRARCLGPPLPRFSPVCLWIPVCCLGRDFFFKGGFPVGGEPKGNGAADMKGKSLGLGLKKGSDAAR